MVLQLTGDEDYILNVIGWTENNSLKTIYGAYFYYCKKKSHQDNETNIKKINEDFVKSFNSLLEKKCIKSDNGKFYPRDT